MFLVQPLQALEGSEAADIGEAEGEAVSSFRRSPRKGPSADTEKPATAVPVVIGLDGGCLDVGERASADTLTPPLKPSLFMLP